MSNLKVTVACILVLLTAIRIHFYLNSHTVTKEKPYYGRYRHSAVASIEANCSKIGMDILVNKNGSAVDSAIATMLCVGVLNVHFSGIGGGSFMTIYGFPRNDSTQRVITTILARDRAPLKAKANMFIDKPGSSRTGALAIAVPGEIAAFYKAWLKFGKVPWKELFLPTIRMCEDGYIVNGAVADAMKSKEDEIRRETNLRNLFVKVDGNLYIKGDIMKRPKLAKTLRTISNDPNAFYKPESHLAKDMVEDIKERGGIVSLEDLHQYQPYEKPPLTVHLTNGDLTVYSPPPPSSGVIYQYILNILDGFNFTSKDYSNVHTRSVSYQRIVEAMKFAYARRSDLGDEEFVEGIQELLANLTSDSFATATRDQISDIITHDMSFYGPSFDIGNDSGTAHTSIIAPDGSAVSITSTINTDFGSLVVGSRTGILFNNVMDDFSTPGVTNYYGVPSSPSNFIVPGKMAMSSMCPSIILDNQTGKVRFITGASGGTQITSAAAFVTIHALWFGLPLDMSTEIPRIHHQLSPHHITMEIGFNAHNEESLRMVGHKIVKIQENEENAVQSIHNICRHSHCFIDAVSDPRHTSDGQPCGH